MREMLRLLRLRHQDPEGTAYPFWFIATRRSSGIVFVAGIWFNRADAENFLSRHAYRFPRRAFVYCMSADRESHLSSVYKLCGRGDD